jgi:DNA-binding XRE family transcriptional regulator
MPTGRSFYQRQPQRFAQQREEFSCLIAELKRLATKQRYTREEIASKLGVTITCINQWWTGYSRMAKRDTIK